MKPRNTEKEMKRLEVKIGTQYSIFPVTGTGMAFWQREEHIKPYFQQTDKEKLISLLKIAHIKKVVDQVIKNRKDFEDLLI